MSLLVTPVPRSLERKTRLFGFELGDLLLVFVYLSISNLVFGTTVLKLPVVWGGTVVLAVLLRFTKRGKPENHLQDLAEFLRTPDILSAGAPDVEFVPFHTLEELRDE